jgi:hypothetical protein
MHHSPFSLKPTVESSLFKKMVTEVKWDSHFHSFFFNGSKFQNITCHRMLREYETLWKLYFIAMYYSGWGQLVLMQHGKRVRKTCFEFGSIYVFDMFVFVLIVRLHVCIHLFVFHLVIMRIITRLLEVIGWLLRVRSVNVGTLHVCTLWRLCKCNVHHK